MQRRASDCASANKNRLEHGHRSKHAGASYLHKNVEQTCLDTLGLILICDGPARRFRGEAEPLPLLEQIHFHNCAIGLIRKIMAHAIKRADRLENFFNRVRQPPSIAVRHSEFFQQRKQFGMLRKIDIFCRPGSVKNDAERTLRHDFRIKLLERTGRRIAWVRKKRQACFLAFLIQFGEAALIHEHFAPYFENGWRGSAQSFRNRADCFNILRDVVAHRSVAACRGVLEPAVFVKERDGHSVHFWFDNDGNFFVRQETRDACVEVGDLFFGVSVVETQHRHAMRHLREGFQRCFAHPLRRRIRRKQFRKARFQIDKLRVKPVILAVADRGRSLFIVAAIMLFDLAPQLRGALCRLRLIHGHDA